jgi:hypothetical protein
MLTEALLVTEPGARFKYQEITVDDAIRDSEVLVEMTATGVCHTDLNFAKEETVPGLFPAVFGHEGMSPRSLNPAQSSQIKRSIITTNFAADFVFRSWSCCQDRLQSPEHFSWRSCDPDVHLLWRLQVLQEL